MPLQSNPNSERSVSLATPLAISRALQRGNKQFQNLILPPIRRAAPNQPNLAEARPASTRSWVSD
jgi:hypothetical protein